MNPITRRKLITTGTVAVAGAAGLASAARIAERYGLIPPDHGVLYGTGETLTYACQRALTLARPFHEFPRSMISKQPFMNEIGGKLPDPFKTSQANNFVDWRLDRRRPRHTPALALHRRSPRRRHAQPDHRNRLRRGLVLHRRVDRHSALACPPRSRRETGSSLPRLFLHPGALVGKHRHHRSPASRHAHHLGHE